jgi:glucosamine--fructose-6-phosphate aminotransferase (isomerizing)
MEVMKKLEGAYALLIKSRHYPGEMVACKRGSPMIVGIKEGGTPPGGSGGGAGASSSGSRQTMTVTRSASITKLRDQYNDSHWLGPLEAWVASDASAVIEHTKRCACWVWRVRFSGPPVTRLRPPPHASTPLLLPALSLLCRIAA